MLLLFVSLARLVYFADHLAPSIQIEGMVSVVERDMPPVMTRSRGRRPGRAEAVAGR
jgi:uncharacterized membrane protein